MFQCEWAEMIKDGIDQALMFDHDASDDSRSQPGTEEDGGREPEGATGIDNNWLNSSTSNLLSDQTLKEIRDKEVARYKQARKNGEKKQNYKEIPRDKDDDNTPMKEGPKPSPNTERSRADPCHQPVPSKAPLAKGIMRQATKIVERVRPEARPTSLNLYSKLRLSHYLKLGCSSCVKICQSPIGYATVHAVKHTCDKKMLLLKPKANRNGLHLYLRPKALDFDPNAGLCSGGESCLPAVCSFPHSAIERDVWIIEADKTHGVNTLIHDLMNSKLLLLSKVDAFCNEHAGSFKMACKECLQTEQRENWEKKQHSPECRNGHPWKNNQQLVFVKTDGRIYTVVERGTNSDGDDLEKGLGSLLKDLKEADYRPSDIAKESKELTRKLKKIESDIPVAMPLLQPWTEHDAFNPDVDNIYINMEILSDFVLNDPLKEEDAYSSDTDEESGSKGGSREREPYYFSLDEADLQAHPDRYRECVISLDTAHAAVCRPLAKGDNTKIKVNGRRNCGPAFDGDHVMVKIMHGSSEKNGTSGRVVAVTKKNTKRRGNVFICSVDSYQSYLMKPLCQSVPKIHIMEDEAARNDEGERNNMVAVYNNDVKHVSTIKLTPEMKSNQLFVVRILKWSSGFMYPLGYVCKITSAADTVVGSQLLLNVLHCVPTQENPESVSAVEAITEETIASVANQQKRINMTDEFTITIDPPGCEDMDDALSIREAGNRTFEVTIHIADVSEFVPLGKKIDEDARQRGISYYPHKGQPFHMLPKKLSANICSLVKGKDRLALSVTIQITQSGVVKKASVQETLIRSNYKLTYEKVQSILEGESQEDEELQRKLHDLNNLAKVLRERRMNEGRFFTDMENGNLQHCVDAHNLVEVYMILCNQEVGKLFRDKGIMTVPFRCQGPPSEEDLNEWKNLAIASIGIHSFYFKKFKNLLRFPKKQTKQNVPVLYSTLEQLIAAEKAGDVGKMRKLITTEELHPCHKLAMLSWYNIQESAQYNCLGCCDLDCGTDHFTLMCDYYVHFTSPIRRYIDVAVHRQLKAVLRGKEELPHSCQEIASICEQINKKMKKEKQYKKSCMLLKSIESILERPRFIPAIISSLDDGAMELYIPGLEEANRKAKTIRYSSLTINQKPELGEGSMCKLKWRRRIYDANEHHPQARKKVSKDASVCLDTDILTYRIPHEVWQKMCSAVKSSQDDVLRQICRSSSLKDLIVEKQSRGVREVTSEMVKPVKLVKQSCDFNITFKVGDVLPVQVSAQKQKGYLQPAFTLLGLTPEVNLCLQHMAEPIECFEDIASKHSKKGEAKYGSIGEYQEIWKPIIAMEAVTATICDGEPVVVNHVPVIMRIENGNYKGSLQLPQRFCKYRELKLVRATNREDDDEEAVDYLCLRCSLVSRPEEIKHKKEVWVAHAKVTRGTIIKTDKGEYGKLEFCVKRYNTPLPKELLGRKSENINWAVEFISKPLPSRRMEEAVENLPKGSKLLKSIVLGGYQPKQVITDAEYTLPSDLNIQIPSSQTSFRNNSMQERAMETALRNDFTLIQGPPGTGKTSTGIKLVYWFTEMNRSRTGQRNQVLYCGPSNSSVDVAASSMLKRFGEKCPNILRVCSEIRENMDFPIPRDSCISRSSKKLAEKGYSKALRDITLHYVIRKPTNPHSKEILKYDNLFRKAKEPDDVTDEQIAEYRSVVGKACKHEVQKAEVILCTCSVSASRRIADPEACHIRQCIIDESGMCMEPEVLIPLVPHRPSQIVLIGDHKQLQPIVRNQVATTLGLDVSMFERYNRKAIMLTDQYRMHPAICDFPSKQFYDNNLTSPYARSWSMEKIDAWPKPDQPIVFCHVEGIEKSLQVTTEDGNEQSKMNEEERFHAVRIFTELANRYRVPPKFIAVLTQYKAQCTEISRCLEDRGIQGANVNTVVASQGDEWDYVILSCVRSLPDYEIDKKPSLGWLKMHMGFINDPHQINVALTRAKKGLIILGNKNLLECDKMWRELLRDYKRKGCILDAKHFPRHTLQHSRSIRHHKYDRY